MKRTTPTTKQAGKTLFGTAFIHGLLLLSLLAGLNSASSQTPAGLTLQLHAGLSITGAVGTVYSIEYATDIGQTNNPSAWRCLEFLQLPASPYFLADKSSPATGRRFYKAVVSAPTNMVFIPPGSFRMGSPSNEVERSWWEGLQTSVIISRGFWMGRHEVTQGEYLAVTGSNPSHFTPANGYPQNLSLPVDTVNYADALAYCAQLTSQQRAAGRIPANCAYRLPTEAEWEYASRAWTSSMFSYGDDPNYTNLANYAWYDVNAGMIPHPVEQKLPNPWGLYDMSGNVFEWCHDWYAVDVNSGGIKVDPEGPATGTIDPNGPGTGPNRILRGGSWHFTARRCRSAYRGSAGPATRDRQIGFRVVLAATQ